MTALFETVSAQVAGDIRLKLLTNFRSELKSSCFFAAPPLGILDGPRERPAEFEYEAILLRLSLLCERWRILGLGIAAFVGII